MKSAVALALLLCMMTLSAQGYIYGGYGNYGLYNGLGYGGLYGGLYGGYNGLYGGGYGGHFPHHSYYGSRLYYNPVHGLHSHGSIHHHDTPIY
uniref:Uncharacterized protein n=1 Tax=Magallana gigas TaxID=29159 RepID=A0A8W8NVX8_MAGGI|nr:keratin-associated protein 19-2 [Crassostrea gigas]